MRPLFRRISVPRSSTPFAEGDQVTGRYVCLGGTTDCRPAPWTRPGEQTTFHQADALTNLFAGL